MTTPRSSGAILNSFLCTDLEGSGDALSGSFCLVLLSYAYKGLAVYLVGFWTRSLNLSSVHWIRIRVSLNLLVWVFRVVALYSLSSYPS